MFVEYKPKDAWIVMDKIEKNYERWLASDRLNEQEKSELRAMSEEEKADAFFQDAEFGTGGLRSKLGLGTNRINKFIVKRITIAFGIYLKSIYPDAQERGVVISHDNRFFSREFATQAAEILNEEGIRAYLFDALRPTPELSFGVRYMKACGGIMITASHNPKEYNGYKVYDETGCQLIPDQVKELLDILASLPNELEIEVPKAEKKNITTILPKEVDEEYCRLVEEIQLNPDLKKDDFKVIYSPQHGASYESAMRVFQDCGYHIIPVAPQCIHDPAFGATLNPNPETAESFIEGIKLAQQEKGNIVVITDPDGDRCGIAYLSSKGTWERFTGNESAALLLDYILSQRKEKGTLSENGVIYDTIVSSDLCRQIAHSYGVKAETFLTGFKYIGSRIGYYEKLGKGPHFEFGYEESYGCLISPFVRDKDGVQAILLYSEMALWYFRKGIPLDIAYENLQKKYGYHYAHTVAVYFEGAEGNAKMKELMANLHQNPLQEVAGKKIVKIQDYESLTETDLLSGRSTPIALPQSNVVRYVFEDSSWLAIRPSGTEPKCKFYVEVVQKEPRDIKKRVDLIFDSLKRQLHL